MPPVKTKRFSVGHYMRTKKTKTLALQFAEERAAAAASELKNQQQKIRRLNEKVSFDK